MSAGRIDTTVLIATFNRAGCSTRRCSLFGRCACRPSRTWDVIVVDNNSSDDTRAVVERHMTDFPVPLQYLFESRQGRSSALNTGIALSAGTVIAFTDDDVLLDPGWLDAACDELSGSDASIGYVGGPVRPIWEAPPPKWLELTRGDLWGTIAIQDHGDRRVVYEEAAQGAARREHGGSPDHARRGLGFPD